MTRAPIVWRRVNARFKIMDMKDNYFQKVMDLIENDFIPNDLLCKSVGLPNEPVSIEMFLTEMYNQLWDFKSLIVMDETRNEAIAGFLILYTIDESYVEPRAPDCTKAGSEPYGFVLGIKTAVKRGVNLFEMFNCEKVLMFSTMYILPPYRHNGLISSMLDVACTVATTYGIPVVACITTTYSLEHMATVYFMKEIRKVMYRTYVDECMEINIYKNMGINKACTFFAGQLPPEPLPPPLPSEPKKKKGKKKGKGKKGKGKKGKKK